MKPIDKAIIKTLIAFGISIICAGLVTDYQLTFKIIASILACVYFVFLAGHIALGFPLVSIIMEVSDTCEIYLDSLRENSEIIYRLIRLLLVLIVLFLIYFAVPILIAMIYNSSFNFNEALFLIRKIVT